MTSSPEALTIEPPLSLLVRGKLFVSSFGLSGDSYTPRLLESKISITNATGQPSLAVGSINSQSPLFSPKGDIFALVEGGPQSSITILETESFREITRITLPELGADPFFSPLGTFLVTWSNYRPPKAEDVSSDLLKSSNLRVWRLPRSPGEEAALIASFSLKVFKLSVIQFSECERYMFHLVAGELHAFDVSSGSVPSSKPVKLIHKGISQYQIASTLSDVDKASSLSLKIAVFVPEVNGKPASTSVYNFTEHVVEPEAFQLLASRTMFAASEANLLWNKLGDTLLVHTHTDVDRSNSSYYGSSKLFFLKAENKGKEISWRDGLVPITKEGPVHDVKWSPLGDKFIVCAGSMPSQSTLFSSNIEPLFEFGTAHRNTVSWSPHGRFVCIAGFGNLAGEMDFYDTLRLRKMGSNYAHATGSHGWSPDSRYFVSSTISPRMNVDNGFKVFKYNGIGPVISKSFEVIYDVVWRPAMLGVYPSRGPSPKREGFVVADAAKPAPVAAPYRPPAHRVPGATSAFADQLKRDSGPVGKVKKSPVVANEPPKPPPQQKMIPGMSAPIPPPNTKSKSKSDKPEPKAISVSATPPIASPTPPADTPTTADDIDKKIKALKKKLKQISDLKSKPLESLNEDQRSKVKSEKELEIEVEALSSKLRELSS